MQVQSLNFQTRAFFFILNFWAAFKGMGLHIEKNKIFGTRNPIHLQIILNIRLIKAQKAM